jgi:hypothetical protein
MKFVYGFIPSGKTLEAMIERRAEELAKNIVNALLFKWTGRSKKYSDRIGKAIKKKLQK